MAALPLLSAGAAQAQRYYPDDHYRQPDVFRNPFGFLFGRSAPAPPSRDYYPRQYRQRVPQEREPRAAPVDYSKAPAPAKRDTEPTRRIVVLGSSMADWLAYGLEEALADEPEFGIVRKIRPRSGLIMLVGLDDREPISDAAAPAANAKAEGKQDKNEAKLAAAASESKRRSAQTYEFRSDKWAELYERRIDATIAALKKSGVPVIWVGLPPVRGTRSTSDMMYLDDLFRDCAERAGIPYVDVWDGFTDDSGHYVNFGPDVEGQRRRLRSSDGVYFTKAGARKLAHYVERELKRVINTRPTPVALPGPDKVGQPTVAKPGVAAPRPLAGPVLPLNRLETSGDLAGGAGATAASTDPSAVGVLVHGEAVVAPAGRADDFSWEPNRSSKPPAAAKPQGAPAAAKR